MSEFRKILEAKPEEDFSVVCTMENGEVYRYDMSHIQKKDGPMILPLRQYYFFSMVGIDNGNLCWPNGYDIHADTVARKGVRIKHSA